MGIHFVFEFLNLFGVGMSLGCIEQFMVLPIRNEARRIPFDGFKAFRIRPI